MDLVCNFSLTHLLIHIPYLVSLISQNHFRSLTYSTYSVLISSYIPGLPIKLLSTTLLRFLPLLLYLLSNILSLFPQSKVRKYLSDWNDSCIIITSFSRVTGNVKFARTFNDVFVLTSICNLGSVDSLSTRTIRKLLQNNYRNLGVYVDTRCGDRNYTVIYSEVKDDLPKSF